MSEDKYKSDEKLTTRGSVIPRTVVNNTVDRRNAMLPDNHENFGCNNIIQNEIINKLKIKEKKREMKNLD